MRCRSVRRTAGALQARPRSARHVPHAVEDVCAELAQDVDDVDRYPVLGDPFVFEAIEIHHPHFDRFPGCGQTHPVRAAVRRDDAGPAAGNDIVAVADSCDVPAAAPIGTA